MGRAILMDCLPWLGWLIVAFGALFLLLCVSRAKLDLKRLWRLHADQQGSAQSLSFVLTLPFFIVIVLFIVQVSQLMIGQMVVEYAAFATARAAAVWIPANMTGGSMEEPANCIGSRDLDPNALDQTPPSLDGPTPGGLTFLIDPRGPKFEKITDAAVMACLPISPSRDLGLSLPGGGATAADAIGRAYAAFAPSSTTNTAIAARISHKLAYAKANTVVELRFYHSNREPPLPPSDESGEFQANELGWQDQIQVKVTHNLALLPLTGRLLAGAARAIVGPPAANDSVANKIVLDKNGVYTYPLRASAVIGNEGEKSVVPFVYVYQAN